MIQAVSGNGVTAEPAERRPTALLLVYCWDLFLAILAVLGALSALGGGLQTGVSSKSLPLVVQIVGALGSAAYAAALCIVASLLTRRRIWVQRTQIAVMALEIALLAISLIAAQLSGGVYLPGLFGTLLFMLIDGAAILVMTERRVAAWYTEQSPAPWWAWGTVAFWAVATCVAIALDVVT